MRWAPTLAAAAAAETLAYLLSLTWGFAALICAFVIVSVRMAAAGAKTYAVEQRVNAIQPVLAQHGAAITTAQNTANGAQGTANTANTTANNAQGTANNANATANNAHNTLATGTTGGANNGGNTSGPQNYGQTGGSSHNGNWISDGSSHNGTWETAQSGHNGTWNTGGQVGGASPHYHVLPLLPGADHTHTLPLLPGADHLHGLPLLPGADHTHAANDGHTHAMAHGHPLT